LADEKPKVLLEFLVNPLGLSVSLRMVSGGGCDFNTEEPVEFPSEFGYELRSTVGDDPPR
jgi:hypothetical protein